MFHYRIRGLIDRHCLVLRDETGEIGKMLAQCNPYSEEAVDPQVIGMARAACQKVGGTSQAIGSSLRLAVGDCAFTIGNRDARAMVTGGDAELLFDRTVQFRARFSEGFRRPCPPDARPAS